MDPEPGEPGVLDTELDASFVWTIAALQVPFLARAVYIAVLHRGYLLDTALSCLKALSGRGKSPSDAQTTEDERLVNQQINDLRLHMARLFVRYVCVLLGFFLSFQQLRVIRGQVSWVPNTAVWSAVPTFAITGIIDMFPNFLTIAKLNMMYVVIALCLTAQLSPWFLGLEDATLMSICVLGFIRLPAVGIATRPSLVAVCNVGPIIVVSLRAVFEDAPGSFVNAEISGSLLTVLAAVSLQAGLKRRMEHGLRFSKMAENLHAASSLLNLTCDAVIELDADLRVVEHSPALAAMLLRGRPGSTLAGVDFRDFLPGVDAHRALELLKRFDSSQPGKIKTQAFSTRLLDSDSNKIRTEVFQVLYQNVQGQARHLIGLRDCTDQGSLTGSAELSDMQYSYTLMAADVFTPMSSQPVSPAMAESPAQASQPVQRNAALIRIPNRLLFVQIDMDRRVVSAASRSACLGRTLNDLFPAGGAELLESAWVEAQREQGESAAFTFAALDLRLSTSARDYISGALQAVQTEEGTWQLMLLSKIPPTLLTPEGSSPGTLPPVPEAANRQRSASSEDSTGYVHVQF
ncbi:unnamed protein product [Symbiodinium pilosum]|uniref:PAS domain-containing protein n=1 Tax=Symbiodinium pilosum TaxID=2952 RepID=A0A812QBR1_SYMPI|nr:unnamed protein product [Symbiodinium pilosum]